MLCVGVLYVLWYMEESGTVRECGKRKRRKGRREGGGKGGKEGGGREGVRKKRGMVREGVRE